jgi:aspartate aminotransferase
MKISGKLSNISESETLKITELAGELRRSGVDVISFSAGEPDFPTPTPIVETAKKALDDGLTKYAPTQGIPELREAIASSIYERTGVKYDPSEIIVTCGAKSAIFLALSAILEDGDEVIIPSPYWVSYPEQVKLVGGVPVIVKTSEADQFKVRAADIRDAITKKTRALILNSPSNPSGAVYKRDELAEIAEICSENDVAVIADEIYDRLVYDGSFSSFVSSHPKGRDIAIYINGFSKAYSMTGWRVGYAASNRDVIRAMARYQGQFLTCIPPFIQKAAVDALRLHPEEMLSMVEEFRRRRDIATRLIDNIPGVSYIKPEGAFYILINVERLIGRSFGSFKIDSAGDLALFLLKEAGIAVVGGGAFGAEGYIRLSFATSKENIVKGLNRMKEAVEKLI